MVECARSGRLSDGRHDDGEATPPIVECQFVFMIVARRVWHAMVAVRPSSTAARTVSANAPDWFAGVGGLLREVPQELIAPRATDAGAYIEYPVDDHWRSRRSH